MRIEEFDVLVVGAGLSGLRAGLELSTEWNTAIISKVFPVRSHSGAAQGGINAALGNLEEGKGDNPQSHAFDTVKGSDYLADQDVVMFMCEEAPKIVIEFESMGAPFSRLDSGLIAQRPFGGAGFPRTCYAGDRTGHTLLHTLNEQSVRKGVKFFNEFFLIDLIVVNGKVAGLISLDIAQGELVSFYAPYVILATGGFGRIFKQSTNALINTGDGNGAAFRAGVPMQDVEFVQFHPTTLYGTNILITEGARGEGGYLFNNKHERFMKRTAPEAMELAPRDIVARAITTEINEGRGINGESCVHLDLRHLGEAKINERLPEIRSFCRKIIGIDPVEEPIPIQPTAHYSMGGIPVTVDGEVLADGQSKKVEGFYAAGECACVSVHGANRLGTNSLLEAVVWGRRAGKSIVKFLIADGIEKADLPEDMIKSSIGRLEGFKARSGNEKVGVLRKELQETMMDKVGVFREEKSLKEALEKVRELEKRFEKIQIDDKGMKFNTDLTEAMELDNLLQFAELIVSGALNRQESRGAQYRRDFPKRDDVNWLKHTIAIKKDGKIQYDYKPVVITKFQPQERKY